MQHCSCANEENCTTADTYTSSFPQKIDKVMGSLFDGLSLPLVGLYLTVLYFLVGVSGYTM